MLVKDSTEFRRKIIDSLGFIPKEKVRKDIEKGIYNFSIKEARKKKVIRKWDNKLFVIIYTNRYKTVINNINPKIRPENETLLKKLLTKKISTKVFSMMNHQDMHPDKWKEIIEKKIMRDKTLLETDMSSATDEFSCYKCHKRKCQYYQLQTRSADEPMTTFITCLKCGNKWKQ